MGEMVEIECPACRWSLDGMLGAGMLSFQEWEPSISIWQVNGG